jgi:hypothetical protein
VQALLQGLILTGGNCFKSVSFFFAKWLLFLVKNPLKSFLFIVKFYISLLLLGFFLTASFSTFAHEVPAKENPPSVAITSPNVLLGQSLDQAASGMEAFQTSQNQLNVSCSTSNRTELTVTVFCTMINSFNNQPREVTMVVRGQYSGSTTYSCPPDGYSDHVTLSGTTCNTPDGTHTDTPLPEPVLPTISCTALAGNGADFAIFFASEPLTPQQLSDSKCSNNVGGAAKHKNSCHIINGAGWTGQPTFDNEGNETGINYTSINGTFSGFDCDAAGKATASTGESCTALDNGRLKKVTCPDGTSMTVAWGDFLDTQEAFLAQRRTTQDDLNALSSRVDSTLANIPTTDQMLATLLANEQFIEDSKGQGCSAFNVTGGVEIRCADGNNTFVQNVQGSTGAKGSTGDSGEKGEDGESCTAIAGTDGVNIVCKGTTQFLAAGKSGGDGTAGKDGIDCSTTSNGSGGSIITCGASVSEVEGVDEGGIISAIGEQTTTLMTGLTYEGDVPSVGFTNSEALTTALGTANDYEVKNYGTVIESAVNEMKESPVFVAVDGFFEVSFNGSCPTYSANVDFMNTSVTMDHWCRPIMNDIWPIIQAIIMFGFSFMAFRVAIL